MSFFDFFRQPDINRGVEDWRNTPGAVLLDVRSPQEYREGHIPGSQNVPLQTIDKVGAVAENKDTPLYVYCHSGAWRATASKPTTSPAASGSTTPS